MNMNLFLSASFMLAANPMLILVFALVMFLGITAVTYLVGYLIIKLMKKNKKQKEQEEISEEGE